MKLYRWVAGAVCLALLATICHDAPIGEDFADINDKAQGALASPGNFEF